MRNIFKAIPFTILIAVLPIFPSGAEDTPSQAAEEISGKQIGSPGDGIVLRIEWNNPFNPEAEDPRDDHTRIYYKVSKHGVTIRIYSINGELVRTLVEDKTEMEDRIDWDGKNDEGEFVGSGVYLVNLKIGKSSKTVKVVVLR